MTTMRKKLTAQNMHLGLFFVFFVVSGINVFALIVNIYLESWMKKGKCQGKVMKQVSLPWEQVAPEALGNIRGVIFQMSGLQLSWTFSSFSFLEICLFVFSSSRP